MLLELLVASIMVFATVLVHAYGLILLARVLRLEVRMNRNHLRHVPIAAVRSSLVLVFGLMLLHGLEIWLYALVFLDIGAVADLRTAVYFSTISFAAIGYSDAAIEPRWALVAAIEGINGLVLLGWSTAYFVTVMSRLRP
ncbi:ion channel [Noviluteimonas gilva]|uniref:Two pore domain potassium channel family protein n=1 Tax=Noviluteimonas gilva TaxID=2682097 RepID=A0A7C9HX59_9GAMM|nr:ion channel [Lysobacter gilvus]MUV15758.1 two pore domain potassium channel family protein [Lysobacter gilvus]